MAKIKPATTYLTLYDVMDMAPGAAMDMLKERYRLLTREHHPDAGGDLEFFKQVTEAGSTLLDPSLRATYDKRLRMTLQECGVCKGTGQEWKQKGFNNRFACRCRSCKGRGFMGAQQ